MFVYEYMIPNIHLLPLLWLSFRSLCCGCGCGLCIAMAIGTLKFAVFANPTPLSEFNRKNRSRCLVTPSVSAKFRPVVILPGLGNSSKDYNKLASSLELGGMSTIIANVSRLDWLRNAAGLLDSNYWKGTLRPSPVLDWYIKRIHEAVSQATSLADGGKISMVGHSAGGWLARIYMAEFGMDNVALLLTLGTPHHPPPKGVSGVIDQTRGLLNYVQEFCPAACYTNNLKYVCIAGRYIKGDRLIESKSNISMNKTNLHLGATRGQDVTYTMAERDYQGSFLNIASLSWRTRVVGQGYKQVCGCADVWGDGIVPEISAHLEGAKNISLDGVYHSPVGSDDISRPWYGSSTVLEKWVHHLLD